MPRSESAEEGGQGELPGLEPSLRNVVEERSLRWVLVGGKGGVGKTACSCAVALLLSRVRNSVLLLSTDPAHSLSDALGQQLTGRPTRVRGARNLFAMEVQPDLELLPEPDLRPDLLKDILGSLPGIDEAITCTGVLKLVGDDYSVIVLDTAATGHTLRLLSFPELLEKCVGLLLRWGAEVDPLVGHLASLLGLPMFHTRCTFVQRLQDLVHYLRRLSAEFRDPTQATFLCVCLPDFLSLYETERLVQGLAELQIETRNIIVNQILSAGEVCGSCAARRAQQAKYLEQIEDLYTDFHVIKLPYQGEEVRGVPALAKLSQFLLGSEEEIEED